MQEIPAYKQRIQKLIDAANEYGWKPVQVDLNTYMIGFKQDDNAYERINVYVSKSTFVTQINHPKKGKGQLFRRNIWEENYPKIFRNPRAHTGRGYYRRRDRK